MSDSQDGRKYPRLIKMTLLQNFTQKLSDLIGVPVVAQQVKDPALFL